jgi:7-cyano-7-deazaguanine synthase
VKSAILLSGGMDSIALAFWKQPDIAITVDYEQLPATGEVRAASALAFHLDIIHFIIKVDLSSLGSGDLAGKPQLDIAPISEWWPFRNQTLISLAAMQAIRENVQRLLIGCVKSDERHADGRLEFVRAMDAVLRMQEGALSLQAPAIAMTSADLIRISKVPAEILAWAHSCHTGEFACGICRGCRKHYETLAELGREPY